MAQASNTVTIPANVFAAGDNQAIINVIAIDQDSFSSDSDSPFGAITLNLSEYRILINFEPPG